MVSYGDFIALNEGTIHIDRKTIKNKLNNVLNSISLSPDVSKNTERILNNEFSNIGYDLRFKIIDTNSINSGPKNISILKKASNYLKDTLYNAGFRGAYIERQIVPLPIENKLYVFMGSEEFFTNKDDINSSYINMLTDVITHELVHAEQFNRKYGKMGWFKYRYCNFKNMISHGKKMRKYKNDIKSGNVGMFDLPPDFILDKMFGTKEELMAYANTTASILRRSYSSSEIDNIIKNKELLASTIFDLSIDHPSQNIVGYLFSDESHATDEQRKYFLKNLYNYVKSEELGQELLKNNKGD